MTDDKKPAISGTTRFNQAIKAKRPELSRSQVSQLRNQYLTTMSQYMNEGFDPAVAKPTADGSMDVIVLTTERLNRKGGK